MMSSAADGSTVYPQSLRSLFLFCVFSRVVLVILIIISNTCFPDHGAEGVHIFEGNGNEMLGTAWNSFVKWDAAYFLQIARDGHQFESTFAFFPLFPFCIRIFGDVVAHFSDLTTDQSIIVAGVCLSNCCFVLTVVVLWLLLEELNISRKVRCQSLALFCFNPASVFFASVYSESFYALLSFGAILLWEKRCRVSSLVLFILAGATRSNGIFNAVFLFSHIFVDKIVSLAPRESLHSIYDSSKSNVGKRELSAYIRHALSGVTAGFYCCVCTIPYVVYCFWAYHQLCVKSPPLSQPLLRHTSFMGRFLTHISEMFYHNGGVNLLGDGDMMPHFTAEEAIKFQCGQPFLWVYGSIQRNFWNVGFMRYYTLMQLPNFLLATPVLCLCGWICRHYTLQLMFTLNANVHLSRSHRWVKGLQSFVYTHGRHVPYLIHMVAIMLVAVFYAHIQISTRLIFSSCPMVCCHVCLILSEEAGAEATVDDEISRADKQALSQSLLPAAQDTLRSPPLISHTSSSRLRTVTLYFGIYTFAGVLFHPNYLPWT